MVTSKKRTAPLTTDELFATALRIVDAEGLEALSMRRLAKEVGVEAASLYHHIPNKDALIDGMLLQMRQEMRLPDPMPTDWMDIFAAIFAEYYRMLAAHPNLVIYAGRRVETDPETSGLEALSQMGFSDDDAVDLWQSVIAFCAGFSLFSSSYAETDTSDLPPGLANADGGVATRNGRPDAPRDPRGLRRNEGPTSGVGRCLHNPRAARDSLGSPARRRARAAATTQEHEAQDRDPQQIAVHHRAFLNPDRRHRLAGRQ